MRHLASLFVAVALSWAGTATGEVDSLRSRQEILDRLLDSKVPATAVKIAAAPAPDAGTELIVNGGFEAGQAPGGPMGYSGTSGSWDWTTSDGLLNPVWHCETSSSPCHTGVWSVYFSPWSSTSVSPAK